MVGATRSQSLTQYKSSVKWASSSLNTSITFVFLKLRLLLHHGNFSLIIAANEGPQENVAFRILWEDGEDSFVTRLCSGLYSVVYLSSVSKLILLTSG